MKNTLRLDHKNCSIVMDKTFAKLAANTMTPEYAHLQRVRLDYPTYIVKQREIKKDPAKECYRGLTYTYMKDYIASHGTPEDRAIFDEMKLISECHSKAYRYPIIKAWFLKRFPEIKQFGIKNDDAAPITNPPVELRTAV